MKHNFDSTIIRAYDIRGIFNKSLFEKDSYFLGLAFATDLIFRNQEKKNLTITVGCDGRASSPLLKKQLIQGLLDAGVDVIDVGLVPTPLLYFSVYHLETDAGIMITGSHNPKEYNGFKMALKDKAFFGDDIKKLALIATNGEFKKIKKSGNLTETNINDKYISRILKDLNPKKPKFNKDLRIVWDAGNGATGEIVNELTQLIDAEHLLLYCDIDGNFPNHHPDPTVPENLKKLIEVVKKNDCDLGIAFDGDGDRIGVVDNKGQIIIGDQLMAIYAKNILKALPKSTIIADVKASDVLFKEIKKYGGKSLMWKTGHSYIKSKMKEVKAVFAGEMSGHIFFADKYYGFDDAIYAAIRLISILNSSKENLSQMIYSLPKSIATPEIRIDCDDNIKFEIIEKLKLSLKAKNIEFNDVDGVRIIKENGWILIRASNTQPALVARCEANSKKELEFIKQELINYFKEFNISVNSKLFN